MKKLLVVISMISILLTGCKTSENIENEKQEEIINNETQSGERKEDNDEYLLARTRGTIETVFENENVIVKSIQFLNSEGHIAYFEPEDKELEDLYYRYNGEVNLLEDNGKMIIEIFGGSFYSYTLNDSIISIVLEIVDIPGSHYNVVNIDLNSKSVLNNEEFIKIVGKDIEQLRNEVKQIEYNLTKEACDQMISNYSDPDEYVSELYTNELKKVEENFDFSKVEFFFNELGNLSFNSDVYSGVIAGIGTVDYLYDIDLKEIMIKNKKF